MKSMNSHHRCRNSRSKTCGVKRNNSTFARKKRDVTPLDDQVHSCEGVLELHTKGYGFLRQIQNNFARTETDVFVPESTILRYRLRQGVFIRGLAAVANKKTGPRLRRVISVENLFPDQYRENLSFDERTPINPAQWLRMESAQNSTSMRVIDLLCPIGLGQRALIASPPRAG